MVEVFKKLKKSQCSEPFQPASEQFNGSGSYGNGAAMRVHPVGMYCFEKSNESIIAEVTNSAKVTHTHPDAINGAILQAACTSWALQAHKLSDLRQKAHEICSSFDKPDGDETYARKLEKIDAFFNDKEDNIKSVIESLGNDVAAMGSVPTAFYAFLAGSQNHSLPSKSIVWCFFFQIVVNFFSQVVWRILKIHSKEPYTWPWHLEEMLILL